MKISWNWLREYLPAEISAEKAADLLTDIGLEAEAVYAYESVKGGLEGLIVGEVVEVTKHPDADKLKLTKVNTGKNELLNIVCGAPNVEEKQKVIVATVGTTVHPVNGEPFIIKKTKIRGVESEGMLCADDEIGLGESHAGLHILPTEAVIGTEVKKLFDIYSDIIIEIGLTANHADANSHYGTARELASALRSREIENIPIHDLALREGLPLQRGNKGDDFHVIVENKVACPRYSGVIIKNISINESPDWLQNKLKAVGMRPINNVVDITNYILHGFGQPLHAFDADKIKGNKIVVKTLAEGTKFITLDEKERKLSADDLMICDAEEGICIAGVYGGIHSGITGATKNIFLESAYFNPSYIRRTEARHGLKTEASARFSKGTDPEITVIALQKAAQMIVEICSGEITGEVIDMYPEKIKPFSIFLRYARLEMMAAIKIPQEKIVTILESLNIIIVEKKTDGLQLEVPSYKNDVTREIDIIEEILRIYGYNHIPLPSGIRMPYIVNPKPDKEKIKLDTINYLVANGFYEIFTNSISKSKYTTNYLPAFGSSQVKLLNSQNAELDCMRQSMLFSGLEVIAFNQNRKQTDLKLFEFGRVYFKQGDKFAEEDKLAIFMTGNKSKENWNVKNVLVDFFDMKEIVELLMKKMNAMNQETGDRSPEVKSALFESGIEIISGHKKFGEFGKVKTEICADFDIKQPIYFAELKWRILIEEFAKKKVEFAEIPKYPEVRRDLSLVLSKEIQYSDVTKIAYEVGNKILREVFIFSTFEGEKLQGKKSYAIGLTFRDDEKTLTDAEVDEVINKMMSKFENDLNAIIRK